MALGQEGQGGACHKSAVGQIRRLRWAQPVTDPSSIQTTATVSWIAQRLAMGSRGHLAHLCYRNEQNRPELALSIRRGVSMLTVTIGREFVLIVLAASPMRVGFPPAAQPRDRS